MTQQQKTAQLPPPQQGFRTWPDETVSIHGLNTHETIIFRNNNRMRMPKSYNGIVGELLTEFGVIGSVSGDEQSQKTKEPPPSPLPPTQLGDAAIRILNNNSNNSGSFLTMTDATSAMMVSSSQQQSLPQPPLPTTSLPHHHGAAGGGGGGGNASGASPPPGPTPSKGRVLQFMHGTGRTVGKALKVGGAIGGLIVGVNIVSHVKNSREVDDFFGSNDKNNNDVGGEKRRLSPSSTTLVNATNERKKKKHVLILPFENLKVIEPCAKTTSLLDNLRSKLINQDAVETTTTIELHDLLRVIHSAAQNPNIVALHANFGEGSPIYPLERGHATEIRNAIRIFNESHRYHHTPNIIGSSSSGSGSGNQSYIGLLKEQEKKFDLLKEQVRNEEKERFLMVTNVLMKYLKQHDPNMHAVAMAQIKECYEKHKSGDPQFHSLTGTSTKARLRSTVGELHWKKAHDYLDQFLKQKKGGLPKYSHAFGHSYNFNTYYLASSCSYVHLQSRGYLNLFGNTASNVFLGGMLSKYGITAHVFKHGQYKNAPSIFTQSKYTKSHLENVTSMISSLNSTMCTQIEESRQLLASRGEWQQIFNYGSLTAMTSVDIGLVDTIPPIDPVNVLMDINKKSVEDDASKKKTMKMTMSTMWESLLTSLGLDGAGSTTHPTPAHTGHRVGSSSVGAGQRRAQEQVLALATTPDTYVSDYITSRAKFEKKFGKHVSYTNFTANESITLSKYLGMLKKKDTVERTRRAVDDVLHRLSVSSTATSMILSSLGLRTIDDNNSNNANYYSDCDKIAVLTVDGGIDRKCSNRVVRALREIKNDKRVKAVVLRVNSPGGSVVSSELILEEIKNLDKPVICSMSNAAASGGYYIAMNSEKIFANPTTITGSIGVFGIKFDASKLANDYGITTDEYPRGSHATTLNPLTPLTPDTKDNITRIIQDYYNYFKAIVSTGRSLSLDDVEKVAQGRVWTGEQAKEVGLVDAIGGLDRAVSYAKKTHAMTEHVEVDYYPRKLSLMEQLGLVKGPMSYVDVLRASVVVMMGFGDGFIEPGSTLHQFLRELTNVKLSTSPHFMMTMDEETALDVILKGE